MLQLSRLRCSSSACSAQGAPLTAAGHDTRQRIMDAARRLMWQQGYGAVSVDHICAAAHIKKGSFYHMFDSKEALLLALFEQHQAEDAPRMAHVFDATQPALTQLSRLAQDMLAWQKRMQAEMGCVMGCPWFDIAQEVGRQIPSVHEKAQQFCKAQLGRFEGMLACAQKEGLLPEGADLSTLASALWGSCMGLVAHAKMQNDLRLLERELPAVFGRFFTRPDDTVFQTLYTDLTKETHANGPH